MDELYGILIAYELRVRHENLPKGETTFKVLKKIKNQKQKSQPPTLLRNFRKDQGSIKASFLSNVLIVRKLGTLHPSVPIPRNILKMKKTQINNTRRMENPTIRKSIIKEN